MAKITDSTRGKAGRDTVVVKTRAASEIKAQGFKWWKAGSQKDLSDQVISTASYLKTQQQFRYRQASIFSRLYGNMPIANFAGASFNKMSGSHLGTDRPTMNVVQSCVDTLISRITQARPRPVFLTDNGDYKERNLAKQMNSFINGELYQTQAYRLGELLLRDAAVLGTGCIKVYETQDHKVALDRVLLTELLVDPNDALYSDPRQLFQLKLVDKSVLSEIFPQSKGDISRAEQAFPDLSAESQQTIADQVMIVEAWHLPSGPDAKDGRHVICCTSGVLLDEEYTKAKFPFVFMHYSQRMLGFWAQSLAEQLMGTQVEINKLLMTISQSINLVGVPRIFVENGSKIVKAHLNNQVGSIITYSGTPPQYVVAPCVPQELYGQLERLVQFAYQQSGISSLAAVAQKPAGLNSGEALRNYDDIQSDRFAALARRYDNVFIDLAYQIIDLAKDIAQEEGKYQTVYPNRNGVKQIDLPEANLLENPFVIQCFDASSLPRDPAGRLQKITEMMQANLVSPSEGRRLLDFPDLEQVEKLANAPEERILKILDDIVEKGAEGYVPPDPFMDLQLASQLVTQYINLYSTVKLEEEKTELLRNFFTQIQDIIAASQPPPPPALGVIDPNAPQGAPQVDASGAEGVPQAKPQERPVSDLLSNIPQG